MSLLLLHCSLAHSGAWRGVRAALGDDVQVRAPDLPGHGRAAMPDPSREYQAVAVADAVALLDGPTHVVGHSFGGTVALRLALERPDLVSRLTLIEPVFFAVARQHDPAIHALHERAFEPVNEAFQAGDLGVCVDAFTRIWGDGRPFADLPAPAQSYLVDRIHLVFAQGPSIHDDVAGQLLPGRLEAIECPVTLVRGALSSPVTATINAGLAARLPHATMHEIQGAGHMAPITHPKEVAAFIAA